MSIILGRQYRRKLRYTSQRTEISEMALPKLTGLNCKFSSYIYWGKRRANIWDIKKMTHEFCTFEPIFEGWTAFLVTQLVKNLPAVWET